MTELDNNEGGQVSAETSDELLSRLLDDAFYGKTLLAVTGAQGGEQSGLSKRFASQFASEAECLSLGCSDFLDRDKFLSLLVSLLGPEAAEYAGDSDLLTIADYAGSLADQERLLIILLEEAESIAPALLDTLYELVDEADEASLSCVLFGDSSLESVIERADPDGGVEDFTWYTLPAATPVLPDNDLEGSDGEVADRKAGAEEKSKPRDGDGLADVGAQGGFGGDSAPPPAEPAAQKNAAPAETAAASEFPDVEEGGSREEDLLLDFALAEETVDQASRDFQEESEPLPGEAAPQDSALNSEFASESFSPPAEEREGSEGAADLSAEGLDGPEENLDETIDEFLEEQQKDTGEGAQEETLNGAAGRAWEVLQDTGIEEINDELAAEPINEAVGNSYDNSQAEQVAAQSEDSHFDEQPVSQAELSSNARLSEGGEDEIVKAEDDHAFASESTTAPESLVAASRAGEESFGIASESDFNEEFEEGSDEEDDALGLDASADSTSAVEGVGNEIQAGGAPIDSDDDFDRDIDDWLEPDGQPQIGPAVGSALEFDFDDDSDEDLGDEYPEGFHEDLRQDYGERPANAGDQAQGVPRSAGTGLIAGLTSSTAAAVQSAKELTALLVERLAAGRLYWLATAGLAIAFIAVLAFWRIPAEPPQGRIELGSPLERVEEPGAQGGGDQSGAESNTAAPLASPLASSRPALSPRIPPAAQQESTRETARPAPMPPSLSASADRAPREREPVPASTAATADAAVEAPVAAPSAGSRPAPANVASAAMTATNSFADTLRAAPATSYTLQILGTSSAAAAAEFVEQNGAGLRQTLGYYATQRAGQPWFVVSYGVFAQRSDAQATLRRLPSRLSAAGPWVRQLAGVQSAMQ
jgi:septal ring-binding cell division protein DamX